MFLKISNDWKPVVSNINNLPKPIRDYIMELETNCLNSADLIQDNIFYKDVCICLCKMVNELKKELRKVKRI